MKVILIIALILSSSFAKIIENKPSLQKLREWLYSLSLLLRNKDNVDFLKIVHSVIWGNHGSAKV